MSHRSAGQLLLVTLLPLTVALGGCGQGELADDGPLDLQADDLRKKKADAGTAAADAGHHAADAGGGSHGKPGIGPSGGAVSLLHFAVTGDTRPKACEDVAGYPTAVITSIAAAFETEGAQFAVDLGDHMYVCNNDLANARAQMALFMSATGAYSGTWFMTMGNHECFHSPCLLDSKVANYVAYTEALAPVSKLPYYSFDVDTSGGRATFVVIADNGWNAAQESWLKQTLTRADRDAAYTIVVRHHPPSDTSLTEHAAILAVIHAHKFALLLTGHDHKYEHPPRTDNGRVLVLGTGGAPLVAGGSFFGYAMVDQLPSGELQVTVKNIATGLAHDTWTVGRNQ